MKELVARKTFFTQFKQPETKTVCNVRDVSQFGLLNTIFNINVLIFRTDNIDVKM